MRSEGLQPQERLSPETSSYTDSQSLRDVIDFETKAKERKIAESTLAQSFEELIGDFGVSDPVAYRTSSADQESTVMIQRFVTPPLRKTIGNEDVDVQLREIVSPKRTDRGYDRVVRGFEALYLKPGTKENIGGSSVIHMERRDNPNEFEVFGGQRVELSEAELTWANETFMPDVQKKLKNASTQEVRPQE